jgi:type IV secretory pathway TrbD component
VKEVSPVCAEIGHFSVPGHTGLNKVRFGGAIHGRPLTAGTYQISIRTAVRQVVRRVTLVVVDGPAPSRDALRTLQAANTCGSGADTATTSPAQPPSEANGPDTPVSQQGAAQSVVPSAPSLHGILGSSLARTARAFRPLLVALLGLAIVLLGVASLPRAAVPDPRVHDVLARHRIEVAGLGVAALLAVALELLLA